MKKIIKTTYTDTEFRQLIREEIKAVLNNEPGQVGATSDEGFINTDQAAEYIKISKSALYKLTMSNTIPLHKKGKRILFKKSELVEWIKK